MRIEICIVDKIIHNYLTKYLYVIRNYCFLDNFYTFLFVYDLPQ